MTSTHSLPYHLDRTILIDASRDTVFRFFTDSGRWASWWGAGSTIDARPGGRVLIRHANGVQVEGEVLDVAPPDRIVFTYGWASGQPIAPEGSRVTIRLEPSGNATRLMLSHEFEDAAVRDEHVQGWRFQLSLFGNVVADEVHAQAADRVDTWFAAWAEPDAARRESMLATLVAPGVQFRDRFSLLDGLSDLLPHIAAAQRFMPDIRPQRRGDVQQCQGTALVDWVATAADGGERGSGTNVFVFGADGRIERVTGFWAFRATAKAGSA